VSIARGDDRWREAAAVRQVKQFVRVVDRLNDHVGRAVAWLTLAMVLVVFFVVVARYGFAWGRVWIQESYVWMHGVVFMLGAAYTLLHEGHVRVDVFYRGASIRYKAWIDLLGSLFLVLPLIVTTWAVALPYVMNSWARLEASREAGGLPGLFLLKTVIPLFCILVELQALALAGRSLLVLRDDAEMVEEARARNQGIVS
jgi:TRAP-type mannitol/chloroaromatic compound transport system permease small subunit